MTGIVKVGTGAGQFLLPFLAGLLIASHGWRFAYIVIGVLVLFTVLLISRVIRRNPSVDEAPPRPQPEALVTATTTEHGLSYHDAVRTGQMVLICSVTLLTVCCLLIILVHIVPHAADTGLSHPQAAGVLSAIGAVSMIGRFCSGWAIDHIGSKTVMVICYGILIASLLWLQIADRAWMLFCFAAIYGLAHGGFFTAVSPIVAEIFGLNAHGALFGLVVFSGTVGGAAGPILAGRIFDITGSYTIVFTSITIISLISLGLILLLRPLTGPDGSEETICRGRNRHG